MSDQWERVDNLRLIENSLSHLAFEMQKSPPSFFRIAREAHQILYKAMIEALKGSNCCDVLKPKGSRNRQKPSCRYSYKTDEWLEVVQEKITGCKFAWRFSAPHPCAAPEEAVGQEPQETGTDEELRTEWQEYWQRDLIAFYPALAKVQTECFMHRYCHSRWFQVSDKDMQLLEWVHESVRNEYEHFVPKSYLVSNETSTSGAMCCLEIARKLLFDSNNVLFYEVEQKGKLHIVFSRILADMQKRLQTVEGTVRHNAE